MVTIVFIWLIVPKVKQSRRIRNVPQQSNEVVIAKPIYHLHNHVTRLHVIAPHQAAQEAYVLFDTMLCLCVRNKDCMCIQCCKMMLLCWSILLLCLSTKAALKRSSSDILFHSGPADKSQLPSPEGGLPEPTIKTQNKAATNTTPNHTPTRLHHGEGQDSSPGRGWPESSIDISSSNKQDNATSPASCLGAATA
ncbi:uncharacterized protein AKAME5_001648800 [Lates japonicus]|uniref:Uncharacterized protein n=1 Tax=Lates japonicus TaxID=270547 RepID=A0AAD3N2S9_LATJO|nr:uncharacterized protein AKAME5_001648800 [Lates japonicus]